MRLGRFDRSFFRPNGKIYFLITNKKEKPHDAQLVFDKSQV